MIPIDGQVVLTAKAMRAAEQVLFDGGMRETALMQRAGEAVAQSVARLAAGREVLGKKMPPPSNSGRNRSRNAVPVGKCALRMVMWGTEGSIVLRRREVL